MAGLMSILDVLQFLFYLFFFIFIFFLVYSFWASLGLHCCTWPFSSCGEQELLFVVVRGLLITVTSLVVEHGL